MPDPASELVIQLVWNSSRRWQVVPLAVGQDVVLEMLPLLSRSVIVARVWEDLVGRGVVPASQTRQCQLPELKIEGQLVADLDVLVVPPSTALGTDGVLEPVMNQTARAQATGAAKPADQGISVRILGGARSGPGTPSRDEAVMFRENALH